MPRARNVSSVSQQEETTICSLIIREIPKPKKRVDGRPFSTKFGDLITADHKILNVENELSSGHKNALFVQQDFKNWTQNYFNTSDGPSILLGSLIEYQLQRKTCQEYVSLERKTLKLKYSEAVCYVREEVGQEI